MLFGKGLQSDTKPLVDIFADTLSHKFEMRSAYASVVGQVNRYTLKQSPAWWTLYAGGIRMLSQPSHSCYQTTSCLQLLLWVLVPD